MATETAAPASGWLRPKGVAERYPISEHALAAHRTRGTGPKFHQVPGQRRVMYRIEDIEAWLRGEAS